MLPFAINHMTVPGLGYRELFRLAKSLRCVGVELRNDLARPLFDGDDPASVREAAAADGLRIVGLSQVYPFNSWSNAIRDEVRALIDNAIACGAETVSLIPRNDGRGMADGERQENARQALAAVRPMLEEAGMVALVEPLGFPRTSSLGAKAETLALIDEVGGAGVFRLVHDTFHHYLAGGGPLFPERTGIVHVSGVVDRDLALEEIADAHRILVDERDRLGNVEQIRALRRGGYDGPISVEAFSPEVHRLRDPGTALRKTFEFIETSVAEAAV
jgi:2-keto-myo-inositol isomerase